MPSPTQQPVEEVPHSRVAAYLVEHHYRELGCDGWDVRRVQRLMGKLGDTPTVLAARMRLRKREFDQRMESGAWTKQDGLILTMLEREVDFLRGGVAPKPLIPGGAS
jgi:hypothetical protein